jgi:hypothetical protein
MGTGYPTTYLAELEGVSAACIVQVGLISNSFITVLNGLVPGGLEQNKGMVIIKVTNSLTCDDALAGWTFGISLPDGGNLPDGGYQLVFTSPTGTPDPSLTVTSTSGGALFYDIDPLLSDFFVISAENADAGACISQNASYGFTGRVLVGGNAVSIFPLLIP